MTLNKQILPKLWLMSIMGTFLYGCTSDETATDAHKKSQETQNYGSGDSSEVTDKKQNGLNDITNSAISKVTYNAVGDGEISLNISSDDTADASSAIDENIGPHSHHCNYAVNPVIGSSTGDGKTMLLEVSDDTVKISGVNFAMKFLFNTLKDIDDTTARDEAKVHLVCAKRAPDANAVFTDDDSTLSGDALQFLINLYVQSAPSLTDEDVSSMSGFGTASESAFVDQLTTLVRSLSDE
ncbi:MAG: hypothetical protein OXC44_05955 [Proteobacteria bacterium]|nr:hypothetical protein [Pseudomonadota bacterium]